jgi:WhiB family transcriptional regulator, redox-sensing transcriptional regulator
VTTRRVIEVLAWHPPRPGRNLPERGAPDWREAALCGQADFEAFFPERGGDVTAPKRICRRCPVREQCLAEGLDSGALSGLWGGLTYLEMRQGRRLGLSPAAMIAESDIRAYSNRARINAMRRPKELAA